MMKVFLLIRFSDGLGRHIQEERHISNFENINSYALQYEKCWVPIWRVLGIDYYKDINFQFQFYTNTELLIEYLMDFHYGDHIILVRAFQIIIL